MRTLLLSLAALCALISTARAEVAESSPSAFLLRAEETVPASPEQTWRHLVRIGSWWGGDHTYSRASANLRLEARAGGCWCERWSGGGVEHGRVVLVMERDGVRTLRINAPLGPLQEMAVQGVLTFTITPHANGSRLSMTYRVAGDAGLGLNAIAPVVDTVLTEQYGRLIRLSTTGSPD